MISDVEIPDFQIGLINIDPLIKNLNYPVNFYVIY